MRSLRYNIFSKHHSSKAYHKKPEIKLNLGCGDNYQPGYINIDKDLSAQVDLRMDYFNIDDVFYPDTVKEVVMVHSLNYLNLWQAREFFKKVLSLLYSPGKFIIETVNAEKAMRMAMKNSRNFERYLEGLRACHGFGLNDIEQKRNYPPYAFSWSPGHLKRELETAGFSVVRIMLPKRHVFWRDMRIEACKKDKNKIERRAWLLKKTET